MSEIYKNELLLNAIRLLNKVDQCSPEFDIYCFAIAHLLSKEVIATLKALVREGPLHDGDVPSKSGRDQSLELRLAIKITVKGQEGYQAATYLGKSIVDYIEFIEN